MSRITAALMCVMATSNDEVSRKRPAAYQQGSLCSTIRFDFILSVSMPSVICSGHLATEFERHAKFIKYSTELQHPVPARLCWSQNQYGPLQKRQFPAPARIQTPFRPVRSLVTVLTTLPQLKYHVCQGILL
jgi:hypothetical protein